jgi:hypothetical protein
MAFYYLNMIQFVWFFSKFKIKHNF